MTITNDITGIKMKTLFEQKLTLQALRYKFDDSEKFIDSVLDGSDRDEFIAKRKLKNVCAALSGDLIDRLENTLAVLNMSKREFFQLAIVEALDKADLIINDVDLFPADYVEESA